MTAAYIAVDWGTTNRRAYLMAEDGSIIRTTRDDRGILAIGPAEYSAEIDALRATLGSFPVLAAGMIGSTRGWKDVPYVAAPADLPGLARAAVLLAEEDVLIVPGVALRNGRADVMRGEEVQALGAVASGVAPPSALLCQPGTHNKWIVVSEARIADFTTAMTGELFALLKAHGLLAGMLDGEIADDDAFRAGVARGARCHDLTVALFEVRAQVLLGKLASAKAASFASGILIGADVGARDDVAGNEVHLLANGALADLYERTIEHLGGHARTLDSHACFAAGMHRIWESRR